MIDRATCLAISDAPAPHINRDRPPRPQLDELSETEINRVDDQVVARLSRKNAAVDEVAPNSHSVAAAEDLFALLVRVWKQLSRVDGQFGACLAPGSLC